jgi:hypothetical protein
MYVYISTTFLNCWIIGCFLLKWVASMCIAWCCRMFTPSCTRTGRGSSRWRSSAVHQTRSERQRNILYVFWDRRIRARKETVIRSQIHEHTTLVEVSGHNLESSQAWGFCMDFLNHRDRVWFSTRFSSFLLYSVQ